MSTRKQREDFITITLTEMMINRCQRLNIDDRDGIEAVVRMMDLIEYSNPGYNKKIQIIEDSKNNTIALIIGEE